MLNIYLFIFSAGGQWTVLTMCVRAAAGLKAATRGRTGAADQTGIKVETLLF